MYCFAAAARVPRRPAVATPAGPRASVRARRQRAGIRTPGRRAAGLLTVPRAAAVHDAATDTHRHAAAAAAAGDGPTTHVYGGAAAATTAAAAAAAATTATVQRDDAPLSCDPSPTATRVAEHLQRAATVVNGRVAWILGGRLAGAPV